MDSASADELGRVQWVSWRRSHSSQDCSQQQKGLTICKSYGGGVGTEAYPVSGNPSPSKLPPQGPILPDVSIQALPSSAG
jgi:hypothetical protein